MIRLAIPQPGQIARLRMRQYLVEEVVPPARSDDSTVVRLSCLDDDAQGQPLEVLWEKEVDAEILTGEAWQDLAKRGFDPPKLFSAYMHTLRWNCVTATDPRLFQSPFRAGIQLLAYQLEPLRKALLLPRVNLFIADDVGLGKTIEAGLILRELLLRKKVREVVVACPPGMVPQWQDELENRFGLSFAVLDREYVAQVRRERGYFVNPWATHSRFLVSQRLLIDEAYAGPLRDWLGDFRPGSLLILDEAHHAAPSSGAKYAIDTKITRAVRDIAPRFEHRLFLSATPHNGHSNSFSALLEILDPQRFCRGVPIRGRRVLEEVMVRRLKDDVRAVSGGFPKREVVQVDVDGLPGDAPELRLAELLDRYRELREQRLKGETKRKQAASGLLICGLQQRLLSSVEAFARTLRVHRRTVVRQWEQFQVGQQTGKLPFGKSDLVSGSVGNDDDRASLSEEELQAEEDSQVEATSAAAAGPFEDAEAQALFAEEQKLLDEMTETAEAARGRPDARVRRLVDWIRENMCPDLPPLGKRCSGEPPQWDETRVLIFTEYDDTKRYLVEQLSAAIAGADQAERRIEVYHGPTPPWKREEIKRAFNASPKRHPVRILIATDAAREGLNLQAHCWNLFHFDVPWNPSRMEQRNGRIDRKLQQAETVFCHYFVYRQRPEDRILQVLVEKTNTIKRELGSLSPVIEARLAQTLEKRGISRRHLRRLEKKLTETDVDEEAKRTAEEELEEARLRQDELREQTDQLRNRLDEARQWTGFDEDHFRDVISSAVSMLGGEPLEALPDSPEWESPLPRFDFPALDQRDGADVTWAESMDSLRAPRRRDQREWEWRRESPIRPVVFEDPGAMDESVVHLHLEHPVARRLLSRFTAQGFVHDDLSRACLTQTKDSVPRVVLIGRLCLYGPGAARLHEQLVYVSARWREPSRRRGKLKPYAADAERRSIDLLEQALLRANGRPVGKTIAAQLLEAAPRDVEELLPHLEQRGGELAKTAETLLAERGRREAKAMTDILKAQQRRVTDTARRYKQTSQLELDLNPEERRQLEANRRHWDKRLGEIDRELSTEPERIRNLYETKASRVEPVGLAYLWPKTG